MTRYESLHLAVLCANLPGHLKQAVEKRAQGPSPTKQLPTTPVKHPAVTLPKPPGVPLMTSVGDPRLKHLSSPTGNDITRRRVWNTAVGPERSNTVIDSATAHRAKHPELFKDVFSGQNIDRPVKAYVSTPQDMLRRLLQRQGKDTPDFEPGELDARLAGGAYSAPIVDPTDHTRILPEQIVVRNDRPFHTLAHESLHTDTVGGTPQEWYSAIAAAWKGDLQPIRKLHRDMTYGLPVPPLAGHSARSVTDATYGAGTATHWRHEVGSQLGTMRMYLEQQGVDTTNPSSLRAALRNLQPLVGDNDEMLRLQGALESIPANKREDVINEIIMLMQGIAMRQEPGRQKYASAMTRYEILQLAALCANLPGHLTQL